VGDISLFVNPELAALALGWTVDLKQPIPLDFTIQYSDADPTTEILDVYSGDSPTITTEATDNTGILATYYANGSLIDGGPSGYTPVVPDGYPEYFVYVSVVAQNFNGDRFGSAGHVIRVIPNPN
jgi:hypothetical protein